MRNENVVYNTILVIICCVFILPSKLIPQSILDPNAKLEEIASSIQQPEGPVWKEGVGLLFSDIKAAKIYKWTEDKGLEVYLDHSDSTNGLTYDLEGRLVAGQMGLRRIVRFETDGTQTVLANNYKGMKFNSPNDLVVKSDGSIFFTDPDFNIPIGGKKEIFLNGKYIKGVYRIGTDGKVKLLDDTFDKPNGICFSPDEKKLYVNESPKGEIYVWDVADDSTITNKKLFAKLSSGGYADGMKCDPEGNLYCTGPTGVWVFSAKGEYLGKITLPNNNSASNCTWGDADGKTLYITAGGQNKPVYKVRPLLTNVKNNQGSILPDKFELFQNYPNPFNPSTQISFSISKTSNVSLIVYDLLGREVSRLINEVKPAGYYKILFNESLPSGIYLYQLTAGDFSANKKMVLLR